MIVIFRKKSNTHHELTIIQPDGSSETHKLETKSYLRHDFIHLALEKTAGIDYGFWGQLKAGKSITDLNMNTEMMKGSIPSTPNEIVEVVTGSLQGYFDGEDEPEQYLEGVKQLLNAYKADIPIYLTIDTLKEAKEYYRQLYGQWNALAFGEAMTITL